MAIATVNPATGETLRRFDPFTPDEIEARLSDAANAFAIHRTTSFDDRAAAMRRAAEILENEKHDLGRLITIEMGKPVAAATAEVEKCALVCRFYADNAKSFLADEPIPSKDGERCVIYQPIGVVLAVMPWNFPLWQVFRFVAPALMAGNVGVLKHSSNVPQCALAIEDIIRRAGFGNGIFTTLMIGSAEVEAIIADPRIAAVTLTGSEGAGRSVAAIAGRHLKKTVLELGGSDPFVVMPTANLEEAVATAVRARMINNGQSCIAAKRFIVHESIYDQFVADFVQRVRALRVGDPMDQRTDIGPLATDDIRKELEAQVEKTISLGARCLVGGRRGEGAGFFYEPTVLVDIPAASPADRDELFGPVASVWKAADASDAIRIANSTSFGLGASAWTNDDGEREQFIREIEAGLVFINGMVASEPALPFGGIKNSGYGRELGVFGIREFVNIKSVRIAVAASKQAATE
ncbi:MAG TPA: NAD-dependent succinate-semialdehyde dehydrogenase [Gemmatimonadaceae bacterium]|nr:NAD-dependent succinate-semialdehyde dehydrogenase [Gemmatimonadaceae bacterium]